MDKNEEISLVTKNNGALTDPNGNFDLPKIPNHPILPDSNLATFELSDFFGRI